MFSVRIVCCGPFTVRSGCAHVSFILNVSRRPTQTSCNVNSVRSVGPSCTRFSTRVPTSDGFPLLLMASPNDSVRQRQCYGPVRGALYWPYVRITGITRRARRAREVFRAGNLADCRGNIGSFVIARLTSGSFPSLPLPVIIVII